MLALEGVTILDLSRGYPSEVLCAQYLSDMGSSVINIEGRPGKEQLISSAGEKKSALFQFSNINIKSKLTQRTRFLLTLDFTRKVFVDLELYRNLRLNSIQASFRHTNYVYQVQNHYD